MNKSYYSLLALLAAGNGFSALAQQQDSTLIREMTIEKEYNPIVREADKITRMPEVETPQANKTRIEYAEPTFDARTKREIHTLEVGAVNTAYPFSKKRGYLDLAGGNLLSFKGEFGYRFLDTDKDVLGIDLHHFSTNGKIDFLQDAWGESKRKINDNRANLYYNHRFSNLMLKTNLAYDYAGFNYYGQGELKNRPALSDYTAHYKNQTQQRVSFGLSAHSLHKGDWDYKMGLGFTGFTQKMPGLDEKEVSVSMGMTRNSDSNWNFGIDMDVKALMYGGESEEYDVIIKNEFAKAFKTAGLVSLKPGMNYDNGSQLKARLGVRADVAFGMAPYVGIAPDFTVNWKMAEHWLLYSALTGGIDQYSLSDLAKENRYYYSLDQNRNSYTVADLQLGIQSNALAGFWFDIYAKAGYTKDELFMNSQVEAFITEGKIDWLNTLNGITADAFHWTVGLKMKYQFSNVVDIHLNLAHNGWDVEGDKTASYKPSFELESGINLRPIRNLMFAFTYDIKGGREVMIEDALFQVDGGDFVSDRTQRVYKLDNLHQLNLKADYRFNDTFGLNAGLTNLLFRKQEIFYGMPEPRFCFNIGGSIRF